MGRKEISREIRNGNGGDTYDSVVVHPIILHDN